jgi:hypothetical protein
MSSLTRNEIDDLINKAMEGTLIFLFLLILLLFIIIVIIIIIIVVY